MSTMTAWLDNFEGVPHADRDGSESLHVLDSPGLSDGEGTSGTPCPTKAVLSDVVVLDPPTHGLMAGFSHVHDVAGACLKNRFGPKCGSSEARIAFLEHELAASHEMVADLAAKLADLENGAPF